MPYTVIEYIDSIKDGGAETLIKDYALLLDKTEFEVKIVTWLPLSQGANATILRENNIEVISMYKKWNRPTRLFHKFCKYWFLPLRLFFIVEKEQPLSLHVHLKILRYVAPVSRLLKSVQLFYTCHSEPSVVFENPKERKAAVKLIKNNQLQLIALHEDMAKELDKLFGINNTIVVRNGIDFKRFRNVTESKEEIRTSLGIGNNTFVIGHIGRMTAVKNHMYLVDIFKCVHEDNPNSLLLMIGKGPLKDQIEEKLREYGLDKDYIILSERKDIPRLLKAMDVYVFPSLYEGLPVSLVEAQVAGVKCVVSDRINHESFISPNIIEMSLSENVNNWKKEILYGTRKNTFFNNMDEFDMNSEIKKLEEIYKGNF